MPQKSATTIMAQLARQADQAAQFLRVLSNGHRLRVLCLLMDGEMSVGEINAMIDVSQSVLSQHLAVLRGHKLVQTRRFAQTIYYSAAPGPLGEVIAALHDAFCTPKKASSHRTAGAHQSARAVADRRRHALPDDRSPVAPRRDASRAGGATRAATARDGGLSR